MRPGDKAEKGGGQRMGVVQSASAGLLVLSLASLLYTCSSLTAHFLRTRSFPVQFTLSCFLAAASDLVLGGTAMGSLMGWFKEDYIAHHLTACMVAHWLAHFAVPNVGYPRIFGEAMGSFTPGIHGITYTILTICLLVTHFGVYGLVAFQQLFSADAQVFWVFIVLLLPSDMLLTYYFIDWCLEASQRVQFMAELEACAAAFAIVLKVETPNDDGKPEPGPSEVPTEPLAAISLPPSVSPQGRGGWLKDGEESPLDVGMPRSRIVQAKPSLPSRDNDGKASESSTGGSGPGRPEHLRHTALVLPERGTFRFPLDSLLRNGRDHSPRGTSQRTSTPENVSNSSPTGSLEVTPKAANTTTPAQDPPWNPSFYLEQEVASRIKLFGYALPGTGWTLKFLLHLLGNAMAILAMHLFGLAIFAYDYAALFTSSLVSYFLAQILTLELQK